jgi:hypothetical protein
MRRFDPVRTYSTNKLEGAQEEFQTFRQHGRHAARPGRYETHVDRSENDLGDKRVLDPDRLEDGGSVVEEVLIAHVHPYIVSPRSKTSLPTPANDLERTHVRPRQLLERHHDDHDHGPIRRLVMHLLALAEETLRPRPRPCSFIQLVCGPLLVKVRVDQRVVLIQPPDSGHPTAGFVRPALFDEPSRGFGDEEDAYAED